MALQSIYSQFIKIVFIQNFPLTSFFLFIPESETLDSWEDEVATTPEDEVSKC